MFNIRNEFSMEKARDPVAQAPFSVQYVGFVNRINFASGFLSCGIITDSAFFLGGRG
jgi:hypothetical protein